MWRHNVCTHVQRPNPMGTYMMHVQRTNFMGTLGIHMYIGPIVWGHYACTKDQPYEDMMHV